MAFLDFFSGNDSINFILYLLADKIADSIKCNNLGIHGKDLCCLSLKILHEKYRGMSDYTLSRVISDKLNLLHSQTNLKSLKSDNEWIGLAVLIAIEAGLLADKINSTLPANDNRLEKTTGKALQLSPAAFPRYIAMALHAGKVKHISSSRAPDFLTNATRWTLLSEAELKDLEKSTNYPSINSNELPINDDELILAIFSCQFENSPTSRPEASNILRNNYAQLEGFYSILNPENLIYYGFRK